VADVDTRTRAGFALGAAATLASLNLVANFAAQARSDAGRHEVEGLFSNLDRARAVQFAAAYVHEHHMRALRALVVSVALLILFALATRPAVVALGRDVFRPWTVPAVLAGAVLISVPTWWLADTAGFDLTWAQELVALAVGLAVISALWAKFLR